MSFTEHVATLQRQSETQNQRQETSVALSYCASRYVSVWTWKYLLQRWRGKVENADGDRKAEQSFHKTFHPLNISVGTELSQTGQKKKKKKKIDLSKNRKTKKNTPLLEYAAVKVQWTMNSLRLLDRRRSMQPWNEKRVFLFLKFDLTLNYTKQHTTPFNCMCSRWPVKLRAFSSLASLVGIHNFTKLIEKKKKKKSPISEELGLVCS